MILGVKVGLGPGHIVLDGDPAPPRKGGQQPPCWAHVYCGQTVGRLSNRWALVKNYAYTTQHRTVMMISPLIYPPDNHHSSDDVYWREERLQTLSSVRVGRQLRYVLYTRPSLVLAVPNATVKASVPIHGLCCECMLARTSTLFCSRKVSYNLSSLQENWSTTSVILQPFNEICFQRFSSLTPTFLYSAVQQQTLCIVVLTIVTFNALTLLVGWLGGHLACKNMCHVPKRSLPQQVQAGNWGGNSYKRRFRLSLGLVMSFGFADWWRSRIYDYQQTSDVGCAISVCLRSITA